MDFKKDLNTSKTGGATATIVKSVICWSKEIEAESVKDTHVEQECARFEDGEVCRTQESELESKFAD